MEIEPPHRLLGRFRHASAIDDRQEPEHHPLRLAAEEDIGADRQIVGEREVLVDRLDSGGARFLRRGEVHRLAVEKDRALVLVVNAGDRLDQHRLAGAVVAGKRHDFAGMEIERDTLQRLHRAEALVDVVDGEQRSFTHRGGLRAAVFGSGRPEPR